MSVENALNHIERARQELIKAQHEFKKTDRINYSELRKTIQRTDGLMVELNKVMDTLEGKNEN